MSVATIVRQKTVENTMSCNYGILCKKVDCRYYHPDQTVVPKGYHASQARPTICNTTKLCNFGLSCLKVECYFLHPNQQYVGKSREDREIPVVSRNTFGRQSVLKPESQKPVTTQVTTPKKPTLTPKEIKEKQEYRLYCQYLKRDTPTATTATTVTPVTNDAPLFISEKELRAFPSLPVSAKKRQVPETAIVDAMLKEQARKMKLFTEQRQAEILQKQREEKAAKQLKEELETHFFN